MTKERLAQVIAHKQSLEIKVLRAKIDSQRKQLMALEQCLGSCYEQVISNLSTPNAVIFDKDCSTCTGKWEQIELFNDLD